MLRDQAADRQVEVMSQGPTSSGIYPTKMFSLDSALAYNHSQHTSYLSGPVISKKELSTDSLELASFSEDRTVKDDTEGF